MFANYAEYVSFCEKEAEKILSSPHVLVQYIRTKTGQKRGVVIAFKDGKNIFIGWSLRNTQKEKRPFNPSVGICLAAKKTINIKNFYIVKDDLKSVKGDKEQKPIIPFSAFPVVEAMVNRAIKYYKVNDQTFVYLPPWSSARSTSKVR